MMLAQKYPYSLIDDSDYQNVHNSISVFGGLTVPQIECLLSLMQLVNFGVGDYVYKRNQLPEDMYIIISGSVELCIEQPDKRVKCVHYVAGDCFGETALIGIQPHLGNAQAINHVRALSFPRDHLHDLMDIDSGLFAVFILNVAREVSRRYQAMALQSPDTSELSIYRA